MIVKYHLLFFMEILMIIKKYDIISEIKQNFHDNEQHIIQAKKYVKINKKLDNDEKLNDDLGLEMENKKNNIICV